VLQRRATDRKLRICVVPLEGWVVKGSPMSLVGDDLNAIRDTHVLIQFRGPQKNFVKE